MQASSKQAALLAIVCVSASVATAQPTSSTISDVNARIEKVENCLTLPVVATGEPSTCAKLQKRMAELRVPGMSVVVVHNGKIDWAKGYGVAEAGGAAIDTDTLFQAGSISKPVAAMAALKLVQENKLSLDSDVNTFLKTWKVPPNSAFPNANVTLRQLLTHTAGLTVHGFPGYSARDTVPTLVQVLDGEKPANTAAIRLEAAPGSKWKYSGGGYTVMQQVLNDVSGKAFPALLQETVLGPLGMKSSTYEQPLPAKLRANAAAPHNREGKAVEGGAHTYPEMAAAGLWTTPSDLAKYIIENQQSLQGKPSPVVSSETKTSDLTKSIFRSMLRDAKQVLTREMTTQMLTTGMGNWGLGPQVGGSPSKQYFMHGGVNEGFESVMIAYHEGGQGAVVMTNAQGGTRLANEVMRSIAAAYDWPDFKPSIRTAIQVDTKILAQYVGSYQMSGGPVMTITLDGNQLVEKLGNQLAYPIFPESETRFFLKVVDAQIEFAKVDGSGKSSRLTLHQNGRDLTATRLQDADSTK